MEYFYKICQFYISCNYDDNSVKNIFSSKGVTDVSLMYNLSVPCSKEISEDEELQDGMVLMSGDYVLDAVTLPYEDRCKW